MGKYYICLLQVNKEEYFTKKKRQEVQSPIEASMSILLWIDKAKEAEQECVKGQMDKDRPSVPTFAPSE